MVGALSYNNLQMWKKPYKYLSMLCKFIQNGHVDDTWVPGGHASVNLRARWTCQCARDAAMSFCRKPPGFFQSHRQVNPQIETRIPNPRSLLRRHGGGRCRSCAPGFRRASGRRENQRSWSPVQYRLSPMAYEPRVYCDRVYEPRRKAPRWIS